MNLTENHYGVIILQEAKTKNLSTGLTKHLSRMNWLGDYPTAKATLEFIRGIPQTHAQSIRRHLDRKSVVGWATEQVYALERDSEIANLCRAGDASNQSKSPEETLRLEYIQQLLKNYSPILGVSFLFPITEIPTWTTPQPSKPVAIPGSWGIGKTSG